MTEALTAPAQLDLFDPEQFERLTPRDAWINNGRWIKARKPELYDAVVLLLKERVPLLRIESILSNPAGESISRHTIRGIRDNEPTLAHSRPSWTDDAKQFRGRAIERMKEEVDDMDVDKLPFAARMIGEMITLAEGGATQRIEVIMPMSDLEQRLMQQSRTGLGAGKVPAMRDVSPPLAAPAATVMEAEIMPASGAVPQDGDTKDS